MEELLQRLVALDDDAAAAMRVIAYFDELLDQRARLEAVARGAAIFSGVPAGVEAPDYRIRLRVDEHGRRDGDGTASTDDPSWPSHQLGSNLRGQVWLERTGTPRPHEVLILQRFARSACLTIERANGETPLTTPIAVETLIDPAAGDWSRQNALRRLALEPDITVRALAYAIAPTTKHTATSSRIGPLAGSEEPSLTRAARVTTLVGVVTARIQPKSESDHVLREHYDRLGAGPWGTANELPSSWALALTALCLTSRWQPFLDATNLGAFTSLIGQVGAAAAGAEHPDVERIAEVSRRPWGLDTLDALVQTSSVRAAASLAGVHHATMQSRVVELEEVLGYSLPTSMGRTRLYFGIALFRLGHSQFSA